jgi:ADP-ribosyl-[dinitrogen reductase] hydrolase
MIRAMNAPPTAVPESLPARPIPDSYWVIPGRFLAGEHPGSNSRAVAMERLKRFLAAGVSCFIDLTEPDETPAYEPYLPFATPDGRRIAYLREPLPDHDVPVRPDSMRRILVMIEDALAVGHVVYLHCRAGVGRSAMVVGCWLASHRPGRTDVLEDLQALWRQSARSRVWSIVPETDEQADYVRNWAGVSRPLPQLAGPAPSLRERAAGALLGLAVGDALGSSQTAPGTPGAWTQHTALALCVAESVVESRGLDPRDLVERFLRWQAEGHPAATPGPQQASADVARALATYRWRGQPMAGPHDPRDHGTASLSRAVVAALVEPDAAAAVALAGECSRPTHQSPIVVDACRCLAAMTVGVLRGDARALLDRPYAPAAHFWDARPLKPEVASLERTVPAAEPRPAGTTPQADAILALAHVRDAVAGAQHFDAAVRAAVLGTPEPALTGALAGALAGGLHGLRGIPRDMLEALRRRDLLEALLTRMLEHRARTAATTNATTLRS